MNTFTRDKWLKYSSGQSVSTKSDYIKILFDVGTKIFYSYSKYGLHAVTNILTDIDIENSKIFSDIIYIFKI